jgi:hypothetical protein
MDNTEETKEEITEKLDTLIVNKGRVFSFLEHNIDTKNVNPGLFENWIAEETG